MVAPPVRRPTTTAATAARMVDGPLMIPDRRRRVTLGRVQAERALPGLHRRRSPAPGPAPAWLTPGATAQRWQRPSPASRSPPPPPPATPPPSKAASPASRYALAGALTATSAANRTSASVRASRPHDTSPYG